MSELEPEAAPDESGAEDPLVADASAGVVGERVSAILRAAEDAADEIRAEARGLSDRLLRKTRETAQVKITELTSEAEQLRREAEDYARDMRMAVEAYATKHRQDAEAEARRLTEGAEGQAKAILETAHARAQRIDEAARRQEETLRAESQRLEQRRRQALRSVGELMAMLEELVDETHEQRLELDETLKDRRLLGRHRAP
jgi:cell division septum initiation protein DivIVA